MTEYYISPIYNRQNACIMDLKGNIEEINLRDLYDKIEAQEIKIRNGKVERSVLRREFSDNTYSTVETVEYEYAIKVTPITHDWASIEKANKEASRAVVAEFNTLKKRHEAIGESLVSTKDSDILVSGDNVYLSVKNGIPDEYVSSNGEKLPSRLKQKYCYSNIVSEIVYALKQFNKEELLDEGINRLVLINTTDRITMMVANNPMHRLKINTLDLRAFKIGTEILFSRGLLSEPKNLSREERKLYNSLNEEKKKMLANTMLDMMVKEPENSICVDTVIGMNLAMVLNWDNFIINAKTVDITNVDLKLITNFADTMNMFLNISADEFKYSGTDNNTVALMKSVVYLKNKYKKELALDLIQ